MYTLVYLNGTLNRPDTLQSFLQANIGMNPLIQVDCVTPFQGTAEELAVRVCDHLNNVDKEVKVMLKEIKNNSTEPTRTNPFVHFMVIQIRIEK